MRHWRSLILATAASALLVGCGQNETTTAETGTMTTPVETGVSQSDALAAVDTDRIRTASADAEWLTYGGTYDEQRFSRLTNLDTENVGELGVAWTYDLMTNRGVETTPIIVDGVMYVTSSWSVVYALDAKTGEELWVYDPDVDRAVGVNACCDVVNRGVAVYDGKIFVGVIDGRLEALDAKTGKVVWSTVTVDQSKPYTITGAPRVVNGRVLIGNGGAELGVRGYITAYDANTGKKLWRFYSVPNPKKQPDNEASDSAFEKVGNVTWGDEGAWVTDGGGGTIWDSIVYDDVNDSIIFGVGNGSPWNREFRDPAGGDNLFLSSIVAVDASTGEYKWHFQTTPGDNWDYTATQTIILADLPLGDEGATRRVAMQAPKNGFFYVIDAETGEYISGDNFVDVNWATGLDENGRPIEIPEARYGEALYQQTPGALGAHNWHPMAFSPQTGYAYIPAQEIPQAYAKDPRFENDPVRWNTGVDFSAGTPPVAPNEVLKMVRAMMKGRLIAWDPVKGEPAWVVEHENAWNGGVLTTAGNLVFQGKLNGDFVAYNAQTGEKLWSQNLKSGVGAPATTYLIDGEQYVVVATGWGSAYALAAGMAYDEDVPSKLGKVIVFKRGATGEIPDAEFPEIAKVPATAPFGDDAMVAQGMVDYARNCAVCHGQLAVSSGVLPDLRWSPVSGDEEQWNDIVLKGARASNGMVSFSKYLSPERTEAIRAYVVASAHAGAATPTKE